jgi:protein arginine kinase
MGDPMDDRHQEYLQRLCTTSPAWLNGKDQDDEGIILSTRVRLARNLRGYPFPLNASAGERDEVLEMGWVAFAGVKELAGGDRLSLTGLAVRDCRLLVERHLISPALAASEGPGGVMIGKDETLSVMLNEEDHLRIQVLLGGFVPNEAWTRLSAIDDQLGEQLTYAWDDRFGFLTACPTNVGTGLRVSLLMHLPALVITNDAEPVLRGASQVGLLVRGVHGEGSAVYGNIFQVSNQQTLGRSEADILDSLGRVAEQIADQERRARSDLLREARDQIEDKVHRALGLLQNARLLTSRECLNLLSAVRLGVNMYVLSDVRTSTLNELTVLTQPAHLDRREGRELDSGERDILRAELVRTRLSHRSGGTQQYE